MIDILHTYVPTAVAFTLGPLTVYWYGITATVGLVVSWFIISRLAKHYDVKIDLFNLYFGITVAALIGARMYHILNEFQVYSENPIFIFQVWRGGLALHGGLIGGIVYSWWWVRKNNMSFLHVADIFAPGVILFQAIGRWGNYFNQELFGIPTELPWSIPILQVFRPTRYNDFQHFHPTFLYESLLNLTIFVVLILLHVLRLRGKIKLHKGTIFLLYLALYSLVRFSLEFIRIDETPEILGVRLPQLISLSLIILIIGFFLHKYFNGKQTETTK